MDSPSDHRKPLILVDEDGPEIAGFRGAGCVYSAEETRAILGGGKL